MQIRAVTIRNFGPYYGEQKIELTPGQRPLTLIYGENMRGKTSLLNAIRWGLYGQVRTRAGAVMPAQRLLNTDAAKEGTYAYSVELSMSEEGDDYELVRQAQAAREPRRETDFTHSLFVRKNEVFLAASDAEVQIARLLPQAVSQFFLFDGEMLNDFEELLGDPTQQSQAIRESIQRILGVPSLQNAINDLGELQKDAVRRLTQAAKTVAAAKKDAELAEQLAARVSAQEEDIQALARDIEAKREELSVVDDELRRFELIRADTEAIERYRSELEQTKTAIFDLEERRRRALTPAWLDLLSVAIRPRLSALEDERDRLVTEDRKVLETEQRRTLLSVALDEDVCRLCGSHLGQERLDAIRAALAAIPKVDPPPRERLEAVVAGIRRLRAIRPAGVAAEIAEIERDRRRQTVQRTELQNRITELETKLRDSPAAEISQLQRHRDRLLRDLGGLDDAHRSASDQVALLRQQAAQVGNRIAQVSDPELDRLNREVEIYELLLNTFRAALADLLDQLKQVIEDDASGVFLQLTTDTSYKGLRINDYYGLFIVDAEGNDVAVRSAGAEQIVALSLIAALNKNAVRSGPVIMDTPFGRLDVRHRRNILTFLPHMADQVVLLVHSGEVDRERDLRVITPLVEREYDLTYTSSARTEILPLAGRDS